VIGGIVVGFRGYLLYNIINKAGANRSRVVRESVLAEAMAANRGDKVPLSLRLAAIASASRGTLKFPMVR
jgi:hypothetical protein